MKKRVSRRRFLGTAAALGAGLTILPSCEMHGASPDAKVNVALVGVGGRGQWFVDTIPRMQQVVAVCDVNEEKIAEAFRHWEEAGARYSASAHEWERRAGAEFQRLLQNRPKVYRDFRKMIDDTSNQVDAVVLATPDHTHAVVSAGAIRAGKHVFCEKPLTRTAARIASPAGVGSRAPSRHLDGQPGNLQRRVPSGVGTDPKRHTG